MTTSSNFIETYTGKRFEPLNPWPDDIDIEDIAHALSNQCRFSGHTRVHYSVAEHCIRVSYVCAPEDALWGLLHDASEAYLVDLPAPLKRAVSFHAYRLAEHDVMAAICDRFGLDQTMPASVRRADMVLLATEARDLMPFKPEHWGALTEAPLPGVIEPMTAKTAKRRFLTRFERLTSPAWCAELRTVAR